MAVLPVMVFGGGGFGLSVEMVGDDDTVAWDETHEMRTEDGEEHVGAQNHEGRAAQRREERVCGGNMHTRESTTILQHSPHQYSRHNYHLHQSDVLTVALGRAQPDGLG